METVEDFSEIAVDELDPGLQNSGMNDKNHHKYDFLLRQQQNPL